MSHYGSNAATPFSGGRGRGRRLFQPLGMPETSFTSQSMPPVLKPISPTREYSVITSKTPSSTRRKMEAELEGRQEAMQVKMKLANEISDKQNSIDAYQRRIRELEGRVKIMTEQDPTAMTKEDLKQWRSIQAEIEQAQEEIIANKIAISRLQESLEFQLSIIKESTEIKKSYIDLEDDDEQHLSSGDERSVAKWDSQHTMNQITVQPNPVSTKSDGGPVNLMNVPSHKQSKNEGVSYGDVVPPSSEVSQPSQQLTYTINKPEGNIGNPFISKGSFYSQAISEPDAPIENRYSSTHPDNQIPHQTEEPTDMIGKLVTALGQAFGGGGNHPRNQIITKQVDKDLPYFSGRPEDWLVFKSEYDRTNLKYCYDISEKVVRLRKYLKGAAKDAVNHLLANPNNAQRIMQVLEDRFGKPKHVLDSLIEKVHKLPHPDVNKPQTIIDFGTAVDALVTNIISYEKTDYLNNIQLLKDLVSKLPVIMKREWYRYWTSAGANEDLRTFHKWIYGEVKMASEFYTPKIQEEEPAGKRGIRNRGHGVINAVAAEDQQNCACCGKGSHKMDKCFQFQKKSAADRRRFAREKKLCYLCLNPGHLVSRCYRKTTCDLDGCGYKHHPLLHINEQIEEMEENGNQAQHAIETTPAATHHDETEWGEFTAASNANNLPIISVIVKGPRGTEKVHALLDTGASFSMLEESVAQRLGLQGKEQTLRFKVFGDVRNERSSEVSLQVSGDFRVPHYYPIRSVHTIPKLGLSGRSFDSDDFRRRHPHLKEMKAQTMRNAVPRMIIGFNALGLFTGRKILESAPGETPVAVKSLLGWYVAEDPEEAKKQFQYMCVHKERQDELHQLMTNFFSNESFGVQTKVGAVRSQEDNYANQILEKTTQKMGERWETTLLWRSEDCTLPESKTTAKRRLVGMERKMDKNSEFALLCLERFKDYQEKGYLVKATAENVPRKWYLPWFFAHHPTKKPRLVFDAASKANGKCLNDFLLRGPDLLRPLPAVLIRFRRHLIALTADIKEMFHQVKLAEVDRPSQTVLFRGMDRNREPDEFVMTVLFFGSASSPCSAIYAKNKNAQLFQDKYVDAVRATVRDFYMDDYLGGADTVPKATELREQLTEIHTEGGFPLVKWNTNNKQVLSVIPKELRAEGCTNLNQKAELPYEKTLGLYWNPETDEFGFKVNFHRIPCDVMKGIRNPTKREIVSFTMSLFDPLGFIAPLKMKALFIIQLIWREKDIDWDNEIPDEIAAEWSSWIEELQKVKYLLIPRCISSVSLSKAKSIQLHVFCDASKEAYACAGYLRINTGGSVITPFIMGKSRVAPLRGYGSIPRMELQAAVLGSRLVNIILRAFDDDIKIENYFLWSDSKTVLCWIRSTTGRYNQFVSNRLEEIWESTKPQYWMWVPTTENPADDATRYSVTSDLRTDSRWLRGTEFLKQDQKYWPVESKTEVEEMEWDPSLNVASNNGENFGNALRVDLATDAGEKLRPYKDFQIPELKNFSCWMRLVRATAALFWAKRSFLSQKPKYITVTDMRMAQLLWIRRSQQESFTEDYDRLCHNEPLNKTSRIFKLSPEMDSFGIIVGHGRIDHADANITIKKPPILDPNHPYTQLMIEWFHRSSGHFGQERLNNQLRQHVWILDCRAAIKRCFAKCQKCKERTALPHPPEMGQLPLARVASGFPPFYQTGVDYFGPLFVKQNRSVVKRWGVMFSCLSCRAVHIELAESLDTSDFINALVRFISIRGRPKHVWSDNGTNFVGAEREMRECILNLDQDLIRRMLSVNMIEWHFIPPASPHMGGSWERMVGMTKRILRSILKEQNPREGTLRTLLAEVTGILNSRPLTFVSPDFDDSQCLTPNHLLNLPCIFGPTVPGDYNTTDQFRKSWRYAQYLAEQFWSRWQKEYLPWLLKRQKWFVKQTPIKVGDLVIVIDDNALRNNWKKGIITAIFPGRDHQIRSVEVKVACADPTDKKRCKISFLRRPVIKICSLGLNVNDASEAAGRENVSVEESEGYA